MKWMLLMYDNEADFDKLPEKQIAEIIDEYGRFSAALKEGSAHVRRLWPVSSATCVRIRSGQTVMTDGPFAETKEQFGGYCLINAKGVDEALQWAAKFRQPGLGPLKSAP